jgi:hypothetical protein
MTEFLNCFVAMSALAADVTGKWTAGFDTQVGPQN